MDNYLLKSIPPQSANVYRMLENKGAKSAKQIGTALGILPNAVYRSVKQLVDLGFVQIIHDYPIRFQAKPATEAVSLYSAIIQQNFQQAFNKQVKNTQAHELMQLAFIHSRKDIIKYALKDIPRCKSTINLIASGLEVPADIILAYKRAVERGVRVRIIVQNMDEVSAEMFRNWQKAGVEVRYFPKIEARIFVFDNRLVYFTSYNPRNMQEANGVRFDYGPFASLMDELFEQRWKLAKDLS